MPEDMNYADIIGLSNEVRQKLASARPATVGMAARIPVSPCGHFIIISCIKKTEGRDSIKNIDITRECLNGESAFQIMRRNDSLPELMQPESCL